jgi:hypothetical protein
MPLLFYTWGKSSLYILDRRLGEPQNQYACGEEEEEKNLLPLLGIKHRPFSPQPIATQTELPHPHKRVLITVCCDRSSDLALLCKFQVLLNSRVFIHFRGYLGIIFDISFHSVRAPQFNKITRNGIRMFLKRKRRAI